MRTSNLYYTAWYCKGMGGCGAFLLDAEVRKGVSSSSESLIGSSIIWTRFAGFGFLKFIISIGKMGALGETVTLFTDPSLFRLNNLEGLKSIFLTILGFGFLRTNTNKTTKRKLWIVPTIIKPMSYADGIFREIWRNSAKFAGS